MEEDGQAIIFPQRHLGLFLDHHLSWGPRSFDDSGLKHWAFGISGEHDIIFKRTRKIYVLAGRVVEDCVVQYKRICKGEYRLVEDCVINIGQISQGKGDLVDFITWGNILFQEKQSSNS